MTTSGRLLAWVSICCVVLATVLFLAGGRMPGWLILFNYSLIGVCVYSLMLTPGGPAPMTANENLLPIGQWPSMDDVVKDGAPMTLNLDPRWYQQLTMSDQEIAGVLWIVPDACLPALLGQLLKRMMQTGRILDHRVEFPTPDGIMSDDGANFAMNYGPDIVTEGGK